MTKAHSSSPPFDSQAFLVLLETDAQSDADIGRKYPVPNEGIRLGNQPHSEIPLPAVERPCELQIFLKRDSWYIHDLTGKSRARLNNLPFQMNRFMDQGVLRIEPYTFEFCLGKGAKAHFFERIYDSLTEDILTKAYNRRYFDSLLDWELRRYQQREDNRRLQVTSPEPRPMSLLMFDLDHFGNVNKKYDHQVGDEILKGVVQRIKGRLRTTDIIARYGGEEFFIYLPDTGYEQAKELGEKVRQITAEEPFFVSSGKVPLHVTISVGVATYQKGMDDRAFRKVANKWMLSAKEQGRNRVLG